MASGRVTIHLDKEAADALERLRQLLDHAMLEQTIEAALKLYGVRPCRECGILLLERDVIVNGLCGDCF